MPLLILRRVKGLVIIVWEHFELLFECLLKLIQWFDCLLNREHGTLYLAATSIGCNFFLYQILNYNHYLYLALLGEFDSLLEEESLPLAFLVYKLLFVLVILYDKYWFRSIMRIYVLTVSFIILDFTDHFLMFLYNSRD